VVRIGTEHQHRLRQLTAMATIPERRSLTS